MRCWKCGRELIDGTSVCVYCGVAQSRPKPVTQAGWAMRSLYDRYGAQEVLTNCICLSDGLGDLMADSKKLRNQIKMAMDTGIGRLYLEQLRHGQPDSNFYSRVKLVLTEEAGMSDKAAWELAGYFDEMIGWRMSSRPGTQTRTQPQKSPDKKIITNDTGRANESPNVRSRGNQADRSDVKNEPNRSTAAYGNHSKKKQHWPMIAAAFLFLCMIAGISSKEKQTGTVSSPGTGSGYSTVSGIPSGGGQYGSGNEAGNGTYSGTSQIYTDIPAVLLQDNSEGYFDKPEYLPKFAFYEDGHYDVWFNLGYEYSKASSTYQVYLYDTGQRTIVCDTSEFNLYDRIAQNIYLTESEGSAWIYNGGVIGLTGIMTGFECVDPSTISVAAIAVETPSFDALGHIWASEGGDDLIIDRISGGSVYFSFGLYRMLGFENQIGFCVPGGIVYCFLRDEWNSGPYGVVKLSFLNHGVSLQILSTSETSGYLHDYVGQTIVYTIDQGVV